MPRDNKGRQIHVFGLSLIGVAALCVFHGLSTTHGGWWIFLAVIAGGAGFLITTGTRSS